jgi:chromosomal replication initiation ATPase DnaA
MFVASSTRTMASAKFRAAPLSEPINLLEMKRKRLAEQCADMERIVAEQRAIIEAQRKEADMSIRAANEALRKLHDEWVVEARKLGQGYSRWVENAIPLKTIIRRFCKALKVTHLDLASSRRDARTALARQAVFYWAARRTCLSLPQIGRQMGRDHTTILYGKRVYVEKRAAMGRTLRPVK